MANIRVFAGAALALVLAAGSAEAQYYGAPQYYQPAPQPYYQPAPQQHYYQQPQYYQQPRVYVPPNKAQRNMNKLAQKQAEFYQKYGYPAPQQQRRAVQRPAPYGYAPPPGYRPGPQYYYQ